MTHFESGSLLPLLAVALFAEPGAGQAPAPDIPRTWDDAAVATFELPLARPEFSPQHVSEDYYYRLPERSIWKSYPIYHPDFEPEGYREYLAGLEPERAFAAGDLVSDDDWIDAGAEVFRAPIVFGDLALRASDLNDPDWFEANDVRVTEDGVFPYAQWVIRERGKPELGQFSCAMCHTRVMPDRTILEGAQGNLPFDRILADRMRRGEAPAELARYFSHRLTDTPWEESRVDQASLESLIESRAAIPPGVLPRQGSSYTAPARIPDLIGVRNRKYLDASGLVVQRGIGDLMRYAASNQGMDMLARFGDFVPVTLTDVRPPPGQVRFPGSAERYSDAQLFALAQFLYSLTPPTNPNPVDAQAERGREVFVDAGCKACHPPPLYTNNELVPATGFTPPVEHYDLYDVSRRRVGTDPELTMNTRRGTGYYKVPSLEGLWYRGPLGHSGAVGSLEEWFDPRRLDDGYVPTGFSPPQATSNIARGHDFGLELGDEDRRALIAFLRTL